MLRLGLLLALAASLAAGAAAKSLPKKPNAGKKKPAQAGMIGFNTRQLVDWAYSPLGQDAWVDKAVLEMQAAGANVHRLAVFWSDIQPNNKDEWDWKRYDRVIDAAQRAGMRLILNPTGSPGWARAPSRAPANYNLWAHPDDEQAWIAFIDGMTRHYQGRIYAIEVWNEQNSHRFWGQAQRPDPQGKLVAEAISPELWTELFCDAARTVRGIDPSILVGTGGLSPYGSSSTTGMVKMQASEYLRRAYAAGLESCRPSFIGFHPYVFTNYCGKKTRPFEGTDQMQELVRVRQVIARSGRRVPIWHTEWAIPSAPFTVGKSLCKYDDAQQARVVAAEQHFLLRQPDTGCSIYFNILDEQAITTNPNSSVGLLRYSWERKPSFGGL